MRVVRLRSTKNLAMAAGVDAHALLHASVAAR